MMAHLPPTQIAGYRLGEVLGSGGMGVVHAALAPDGREVAVKLLRAAALDGETEQRFAREAAIRIDHPNVVQVLDSGTDDDGHPYIVFERLRGTSVDRLLDAGPMDVPEVVALARDACRGLEAVHAAGIVHRDLKPANLFRCDDGTLKVLDFGIARVGAATRVTSEGSLLGTAFYLAPEQAKGRADLDARADLWALGVLMYEALAGTGPFEKDSWVGTLLSILSDEPVPLDARGVPTPLWRIVAKCLAKEPSARWPDAGALRAALESLALPEGGSFRVDFYTAPTGLSGAPARMPLPTDEQRVVTAVVARGVTDRDAVRRTVEQQGGVAIPLLERELIGLFGSEQWRGDEARRALDAAIEARPWASQIGLGSGRAIGAGGLVAGEAVRAAERASRRAAAGVVAPASFLLAFDPPPPHDPLPDADGLVEIREPAADPRRGVPARGPTLGRKVERAWLLERWRRAVEAGGPVVAWLRGPAGIGKSHLAAALGEEVVSGGRVLRVRASPDRRDRALAVLADVVRADLAGDGVLDAHRLEAHLRDLLDDAARAAECATFLGELLGLPVEESIALLTARSDHQLMADMVRLAVEDYLRGTLDRGATLLVVDDAHHADDVSLEVLGRLPAFAPEGSAFVLLVGRPDPRPLVAEATPDDVLDVGPLSEEEALLLAQRTVAPAPLDPELARSLARRADGNPFFVEQIARVALAASGGDLPLPFTVEGAVQSRLRSLSAASLEASKSLAVVQRPTRLDELRVLGVDDPDAVVADLLRSDVLQREGAEGRVWFRSSLLAEVAYRMLSNETQARLHGRLVDHLAAESDPDPEELARHAELAGRVSDAATWHVLAARRAHVAGDSAAALHASGRALALGVEGDDRFEMHTLRADVLRFMGDRQAQAAELEQALKHTGRPLDKARALSEYAAWMGRMGRHQEAVALARSAARTASGLGAPELHALALARQGEAYTLAGDYTEAARAADEGFEVLAGREAPAVEGTLHAVRAQVATLQGDVGASREARARVVECLERAGDRRRAASNRLMLADSLNRVGLYEEAAEALRRGLDDCRRTGNLVVAAYALVNLGYASFRLGQFEAAQASLNEASAQAEVTGDARLALYARLYRARARAAAGEWAGARADAEALAQDARQARRRSVEAMALAVAAHCALAADDVDAAVVAATRAATLTDELGGIEEDEALVRVAQADALDRAGRPEDARAIRRAALDKLEALAARIGDPRLRRSFLEQVPEHAALRAALAG